MKLWLGILGVVLLTTGLVLTVTYNRPDCSGIACPVVFPALELSSVHIENGGNANAYVLAFEGNCSDDSYEVISESLRTATSGSKGGATST